MKRLQIALTLLLVNASLLWAKDCGTGNNNGTCSRCGCGPGLINPQNCTGSAHALLRINDFTCYEKGMHTRWCCDPSLCVHVGCFNVVNFPVICDSPKFKTVLVKPFECPVFPGFHSFFCCAAALVENKLFGLPYFY